MTKQLTFFFGLLGFVFSSLAEVPVPKKIDRSESEGQQLAAELRSSVPEQNTEIRGVLKIRSKKQRITNDVPVIFQVVVSDDFWETIYETGQTEKQGSEKLVIRHFENKPNQYFYAKAPTPTAALPELRELSSREADIPLGNSDFWLSELGLDFLHWPLQRRLQTDGRGRLGRTVHTLESVDFGRKTTHRIVSSIDKETGGILVAEAYGPGGKQIKEFSLSGSSFKKINGQMQLEKMTIYDRLRGSTTVLQFDLDTPAVTKK